MKKFLALCVLIFFTAGAYAQDSSAAKAANAYLIPKEIYVGDRASLVIPLPAAAHASENTIITLRTFDPSFPSDPNIDFHSIILERHVSGSKLTIEFTPFVSGAVKFPVIEIEKEHFPNLSVIVNSAIDSRYAPVLQRAAPVLVMPGTATMIYGALAAIVFIIFFTIWFVLKGRAVFRELYKKWKRRRLFISMKKTEKNLRRMILKGSEKRIVLDSISEEFKNFLSVLTDINCRAMTAREFEMIRSDYFIALEDSPAFLGKFFRNCDNMRFSGIKAESGDITALLDELKNFIENLENSRKNIPKEEKAA